MAALLKAEILGILEGYASENHAHFCAKLTPTNSTILGVKVPLLRKIAKDLSDKQRDFLLTLNENIFELLMLRAIVIGDLKCSNLGEFELVKMEITKFLPLIDNWAVCDILACGLKKFAKNAESYEFAKSCINANEPFIVRFGVVMLLAHFVNEKNISEILRIAGAIKRDEYYVVMSVAWLLSVCFVKFPRPTQNLLAKKTLDKITQNKAIQKICESLRVSERDKAEIRELKIK